MLGADRRCSGADLRKHYKALALRYHPDRNESDTTAVMMQINSAYHTLSDPVERAKYDKAMRSK